MDVFKAIIYHYKAITYILPTYTLHITKLLLLLLHHSYGK